MRHMERGEPGLQLTLGGFFMVLPTLSVIVGLVMMFMWWRNKDDVEVSQTEGVVQMRNYRIRRNEFFEMKLNGMTFPLSPDYFYTIKNGVRYRIYYVASTKHLLALEPLEQA